MMKYLLIFLPFLLMIFGCKQKPQEKDLVYLNGFWQIKNVSSENIDNKEFQPNGVLDYFEYHQKQGIRKKAMPDINGNFLTNDIEEKFTIIDSASYLFIKYQTPFATWKEKIIYIKETEFQVENDKNIVYTYTKINEEK